MPNMSSLIVRRTIPRAGPRVRSLHARSGLTALALTSLLLSCGIVTPLTAQTRGEAPLFVAIPETFPDVDARAVVIREPGREVVLLRADEADPQALASALRVLAKARENALPAGRGQLIPITGFAFPAGIADEERSRLDALLAQLRQRPISNVGNLGPGRWLPYTER